MDNETKELLKKIVKLQETINSNQKALNFLMSSVPLVKLVKNLKSIETWQNYYSKYGDDRCQKCGLKITGAFYPQQSMENQTLCVKCNDASNKPHLQNQEINITRKITNCFRCNRKISGDFIELKSRSYPGACYLCDEELRSISKEGLQ